MGIRDAIHFQEPVSPMKRLALVLGELTPNIGRVLAFKTRVTPMPWVDRTQELLQLLNGSRPGQIEALTVTDTGIDEGVELLDGLDSLRDHLGSDLVPKGYECTRQSPSHRMGIDSPGQLPVELDDVWSNLKDNGKASKASTGIIDGDSAAKTPKPLTRLLELWGIDDIGVLGELDDHPCRVNGVKDLTQLCRYKGRGPCVDGERDRVRQLCEEFQSTADRQEFKGNPKTD